MEAGHYAEVIHQRFTLPAPQCCGELVQAVFRQLFGVIVS
jgi:hypothetical protein